MRRGAAIAGVVLVAVAAALIARQLIDGDTPAPPPAPTADDIARRVDHAELCHFERTGRYTDRLAELGLGGSFARGGFDVHLDAGSAGARYAVRVTGPGRDVALVERRPGVTAGIADGGTEPAESC